MTANALTHGSTSADVARRGGERRSAAAASSGTGLGGNTMAHIVEENCADLSAAAGVMIEHLDAQAGTWQFSADQGKTWRAIRTDLINRTGNLGLALDSDARLRVLPFGGHRATGARVAFHTVQRSHGQSSGSYLAYASEERETGSRTVTLVLSLAAINGEPPAVHVPRLRNKRALARQAAASSAEVTQPQPQGQMALA